MTAPERIWLQDDGDYELAREAMSDLTWCSDPINDADTEYVRADIYEAAIARAEKSSQMAQVAARLADYHKDSANRLAALLAEAVEALDRGLNYLENTEGEFGIELGCANQARATLARIKEAENG